MDAFDQTGDLESRLRSRSHDRNGSRAAPESALIEESQLSLSACKQNRALTQHLMEEVCRRDNLNQAYLRVKRNKGSAGVDGMKVEDLHDWIVEHKHAFIQSLLNGDYKPDAVRGVKIPKSGGGQRQLGIPTVRDRLVQQAILQVLSPLLEKKFSNASHGFRPKRSAHSALKESQKYVKSGKLIVVDIDLEKFFDKVNHDRLMNRLSQEVGDKRLLRIIGSFLRSGMIEGGLGIVRREGTPQGGPLSPLLANFVLDELDKELEHRGHSFVRYADDCNIYVRTKRAGERVMHSVKRFIEDKLKLKVNETKSSVSFVGNCKFLGHRILAGGRLSIAPKSLREAKKKLKVLLRRTRGRKLEQVIHEVNRFTIGWIAYYRDASMRNHTVELDSWIRRKLRCYRIKQCKRKSSIRRFLEKLGVPKERARLAGVSRVSWWRLSGSPPVHEGMNNKWFKELGLSSLEKRWKALQT